MILLFAGVYRRFVYFLKFLLFTEFLINFNINIGFGFFRVFVVIIYEVMSFWLIRGVSWVRWGVFRFLRVIILYGFGWIFYCIGFIRIFLNFRIIGRIC